MTPDEDRRVLIALALALVVFLAVLALTEVLR